MRCYPVFILIFFGLFAFYCETAFADSYVIKFKPINPKGEVRRILCADGNECSVKLDLEYGPNKKGQVIARAKPNGGGIAFRFQTPNGFFYVGEKSASETTWVTIMGPENKAKEKLSLFLPLAPKGDLFVQDLVYMHRAVAYIEITVDPAP